jgi:hypothetical protein
LKQLFFAAMADIQTTVPFKSGIRITAVLLGVSSLILMIVGGLSYSYVTNVHLGSWWAGLACFLAAMFGAFSGDNRCLVVTSCVLASIAVVVTLIGLIVDSIAAGVIGDLDGCANYPSSTSQVQYYDNGGSSTTQSYAVACADPGDDECNCVKNSNWGTCYLYQLASGTDCYDVFNEYHSLLSGSASLGAINLVIVLTYSIMTCSSLCGCCPPPKSNDSPVAETPVVVQSPVASVVYNQNPTSPGQPAPQVFDQSAVTVETVKTM